MDLNKRQYDLGPTDRWEYPNYFGDIKAGLSWFTLEIYYWLIYAPPLLYAFVHFFVKDIQKMLVEGGRRKSIF